MYKTPFPDLVITLVKHDTSLTGLPCYTECHVGTVAKADRAGLVLDLGNYIYRTLGLRYQMVPEFRGRGKSQTLRWFMSWEDVMPIMPNIFAAMRGIDSIDTSKMPERWLPYSFRSLIIQNSARGVVPQERETA